MEPKQRLIYSHSWLAAPGSPQRGRKSCAACSRSWTLLPAVWDAPNLPGAQIILTELCSAACWKLQPPLIPVARVICPWKILFFRWRQESKLYWTQNPRRGHLSSGKPHPRCCFPSNDASVLCCQLQSRTHSPRREGRTSVTDWKAIALNLKCWRNSLFSVYLQSSVASRALLLPDVTTRKQPKAYPRHVAS